MYRIRMTQIALLLIVAVLLGGCPPAKQGNDTGRSVDGGVDAMADAGEVGGQPPASCTPSEKLLAEEQACVHDEDCPCGAHCSLGRCTTQCRSDDDCEGKSTCDSFGRCTNGGDSSTGLPDKAGRLFTDTTSLEFLAADDVRLLQFGASGAELSDVRIEADAALEIQCPGSDTWGQRCNLSGIAPDKAPKTLMVRLTDGDALAPNSHFEIRMFTPHGQRRIGVDAMVDHGVPQLKPDAPGHYTGYAWPVAAGFSSQTKSQDLPPELKRVRIPVDASVFPVKQSQHTVVIDDSLRLVFPKNDTVASLQRQGNSGWRFAMRPHHFAGPPEPGLDDVEIAVSGRADSEDVFWNDGQLSFRYRASFEGATLSSKALYVDWQVSLSRADDLASEASEPSQPSAYNPAHSVKARAQKPRSIAETAEKALASALSGLKGKPAQLASAFHCTPAGASKAVQLDDTVASDADDNPVPTADLGCEDGSPDRIFALAHRGQFSLEQTLADCKADLQNFASLASGGGMALTNQGCLDAARAFAVWRHGFRPDRRRALGETVPVNNPATSLAHRVTQRWLQTHSHIAHEALKVADFNAVIAKGGTISLDWPMAKVADRLVGAWAPILHPRIAVPLSHIDPAYLQKPDYRPIVAPSGSFNDAGPNTHDVGLPVTLVDSYNEQLQFFSQLVQRARSHRLDFQKVEPGLQKVLRRGLIALALSKGIYANTRTRGVPSWQQEWKRTQIAFGSQFTGLMRQLRSLAEGKNPLGIEEVDLPIYRVGDQTKAGKRFQAISDFLIGDDQSKTGIVPDLIDRTNALVEKVREAYVKNQRRKIREQTRANGRQRRLEALRRRYGKKIISLCGNPDWKADTVLQEANSIDADSCFLKESCQFDTDEIMARLNTADFGYEICVASGIRQTFGPSASTGDPKFDRYIDQLGDLINDRDDEFGFELQKASNTEDTIKVVADKSADAILKFAPESMRSFDIKLDPPDGPASDRLEKLRQIRSGCSFRRATVLQQRPSTPPGSCKLSDDCPYGYFCHAGTCHPDSASESTEPSCYRGALGEAALELKATAKDIEIARAEMTELTNRYDIAMRSCMIAKMGNQAQEKALENHIDTMNAMNGALDAAGSIADLAHGAREKIKGDGLVAKINRGALSVLEFGAKKSNNNLLTRALGKATKTSEKKHELTMKKIESAVEEKQCFNDAEMHLVGTRTASLKIKRRALELSKKLVQFNNLKRELNRLVEEGRTAVEREKSRKVSPLTTDFWLDEKIEKFDDYFRISQRATYLAVRAVEYEFQFSSAQRTAVLKARMPGELEKVLENLRSFTRTGRVGGGSPDEALVVISLRDHLLQLADREDFPKEFHRLSKTQRLRRLLTSPRNAVYDDGGNYLGQEIRFNIAPVGKSGLGDSQGISLLNGTDCAERVWTVNASLKGNDLYEGSDTTFARIVLRHRNTFFSQWCDGSERDTDLQVASTRPGRNLFYDPYAVEDSKIPSTRALDSADKNEARAFSNARISAYFNISQGDLEMESYENGQSQELAGRGLYGDYALFFPADNLSQGDGRGLRLDGIEDILLRLDYVSVAKN